MYRNGQFKQYGPMLLSLFFFFVFMVLLRLDGFIELNLKYVLGIPHFLTPIMALLYIVHHTCFCDFWLLRRKQFMNKLVTLVYSNICNPFWITIVCFYAPTYLESFTSVLLFSQIVCICFGVYLSDEICFILCTQNRWLIVERLN